MIVSALLIKKARNMRDLLENRHRKCTEVKARAGKIPMYNFKLLLQIKNSFKEEISLGKIIICAFNIYIILSNFKYFKSYFNLL